uniref:Uncharacterized protein n=1 Tax=Scleropages formosus TaxID=113540 RepID=A0A8C9SBD0_SCLFO
MSDSGAKGNQGMVRKDKDGTEKRGWGRPRKPLVRPGLFVKFGSPTPKKPRGQPKGSKNKSTAKGKASHRYFCAQEMAFLRM